MLHRRIYHFQCYSAFQLFNYFIMQTKDFLFFIDVWRFRFQGVFINLYIFFIRVFFFYLSNILEKTLTWKKKSISSLKYFYIWKLSLCMIRIKLQMLWKIDGAYLEHLFMIHVQYLHFIRNARLKSIRSSEWYFPITARPNHLWCRNIRTIFSVAT